MFVLLRQGLNAPNRAITIASDFHIHGAKSPEFPQKRWGLGSESRSSKSQIAGDFPTALFWLVSKIDRLIDRLKDTDRQTDRPEQEPNLLGPSSNRLDPSQKTDRLTDRQMRRNSAKWGRGFDTQTFSHGAQILETVNACSSLAPVLQHGDRENRVELRDMFFQAGEDLLVHGACISHAYALSSYLG